MTYRIVWEESALNSAAGFLKTESHELGALFAFVDLLAEEPRPRGSLAYGSDGLRRAHCGRYRVIYEISEATVTIIVLHLGRVP